MYYIYGISESSLLIESTNSMIVHRVGVAQNGVLSLEQDGVLYICMITVYGSLMHVHLHGDGGLQLEQHDSHSVFVHLSM